MTEEVHENSNSFLSYFIVYLYRTELQKVDFDDGQLLEILRGKDNQIVALEGQVRKNRTKADVYWIQVLINFEQEDVVRGNLNTWV